MRKYLNSSEVKDLTSGIQTPKSPKNENVVIKRKSLANLHNSIQGSLSLKIKNSPALQKSEGKKEFKFEGTSLAVYIHTFLSYLWLIITGYLQSLVYPTKTKENNRQGYVPLYSSFESFFRLTVFRAVSYCFHFPIFGVPGEIVDVRDRITEDYGATFQTRGKIRKCINLGSYNYLGFAQKEGTCTEEAVEKLQECGTSVCSGRKELGNASYLKELDDLVAKFLGVEDAITCPMGYATNALNLPILVSKGCLVLSDEKNHASIIVGLKLSGATIRVIKHNDMTHLEQLLRDGVLKGQPRTAIPWEKIFIVVEGIYSMEGTIVPLPKILELKRKYKAYLYLDEAHSIGAMGKSGRGVVDYWDVDPKEVDILMGTFTKSFGSAGGYISGSRHLIQMLRDGSHAQCYGTAMSPPVAQQIITSMRIIMGEDGTDEGVRKIEQLARNAKYFRQKLEQKGFVIYGNEDSPVVPVAFFVPAKAVHVTHELFKRGVAAACVGYPGTPLAEARIRFCVSSGHTKQMLDKAIELLTELGNNVKVCKSSPLLHKGEIKYGDSESLEYK